MNKFECHTSKGYSHFKLDEICYEKEIWSDFFRNSFNFVIQIHPEVDLSSSWSDKTKLKEKVYKQCEREWICLNLANE